MKVMRASMRFEVELISLSQYNSENEEYELEVPDTSSDPLNILLLMEELLERARETQKAKQQTSTQEI